MRRLFREATTSFSLLPPLLYITKNSTWICIRQPIRLLACSNVFTLMRRPLHPGFCLPKSKPTKDNGVIVIIQAGQKGGPRNKMSSKDSHSRLANRTLCRYLRPRLAMYLDRHVYLNSLDRDSQDSHHV
jgi:hypothetical protein